MNDSCSNIIDTPFKKLKTTNPNNSSSRKGSLKGKTNLINERNFHTLKRMENLNNALSFIREKKNISKQIQIQIKKIILLIIHVIIQAIKIIGTQPVFN